MNIAYCLITHNLHFETNHNTKKCRLNFYWRILVILHYWYCVNMIISLSAVHAYCKTPPHARVDKEPFKMCLYYILSDDRIHVVALQFTTLFFNRSSHLKSHSHRKKPLSKQFMDLALRANTCIGFLLRALVLFLELKVKLSQVYRRRCDIGNNKYSSAIAQIPKRFLNAKTDLIATRQPNHMLDSGFADVNGAIGQAAIDTMCASFLLLFVWTRFNPPC